MTKIYDINKDEKDLLEEIKEELRGLNTTSMTKKNRKKRNKMEIPKNVISRIRL